MAFPVDCARRALCRVLAAGIGIASFGVFGEDDSAQLVGTWRGPWYLGMTSGTATLIVERHDPLAGSLQMTNNENFGSDVVGLRDLVVVDGKFRFRAVGEDGRTMNADLPVDLGRGSMKGPAKYGGYKLRFELMRAATQ